jgi:hypothetical protein
MGFPSVTLLASTVAVKYVGLPPSREQPLPEVEVTTPPLHVQGPVLDDRETEDLAQLEAGVQDLRSTQDHSRIIDDPAISRTVAKSSAVLGSLVHLKTSRRPDAL